MMSWITMNRAAALYMQEMNTNNLQTMPYVTINRTRNEYESLTNYSVRHYEQSKKWTRITYKLFRTSLRTEQEMNTNHLQTITYVTINRAAALYVQEMNTNHLQTMPYVPSPMRFNFSNSVTLRHFPNYKTTNTKISTIYYEPILYITLHVSIKQWK